MFGIDSSELAIIALVALLVIGPKDLPRVMRSVGNWIAKGRAMTRHVRSGFDTMMREAEMEEMQKLWAAQNEAIMKSTALDNSWAEPAFDSGELPPPLEPDPMPSLAGPVPAEPVPAPSPPKPRQRRAKAAPAPEISEKAPRKRRTKSAAE